VPSTDPLHSEPAQPPDAALAGTLELAGTERVLAVGCSQTLCAALKGGARAVRAVAAGRGQRRLPLGVQERGRFDVAVCRGVPPVALLLDLVHAARPGGRVALFRRNPATARPIPAVPGFAEAWTACLASLCFDEPELSDVLRAAGVTVRRRSRVVGSHRRGERRFDAADRAVRRILRAGRDRPGADRAAIDAVLRALRGWRHRDDAAWSCAADYAEGRPRVAALIAVTP
jgi:hypothetical protein